MYSRTLLRVHAEWRRTEQRYEPPAHGLKEPIGLIAIDLDQGFWVARRNWPQVQALMGTRTGTAKVENANLVLLRGDSEPVVFNQYFSNGHPRASGAAFTGTEQRGSATAFRFRTDYQRFDDPTIMTPEERMAEILDRAVKSEKLKARFREQLGGMVDPTVLLHLAGLFVAIFGAQFVGGAAAAAALGRLVGVTQLMCSYYVYEPLANEINRAVMSAQTPSDLDRGADAMASFIAQAMADMATCLGISLMTQLAAKLLKALIAISPQKFRDMAMKYTGYAEAWLNTHGYKAREQLKPPERVMLEQQAVDGYKAMSVEKREAIVVREPGQSRLTWIQSHVWNRAKPVWLKAKSSAGWHALISIPKTGIGGELRRAGTYDLGNLKGVLPEVDAAIARQRTVPATSCRSTAAPSRGSTIRMAIRGPGTATSRGTTSSIWAIATCSWIPWATRTSRISTSSRASGRA